MMFLAQRRKGAKEDAKLSRRLFFASSFAPLRLCARIFLTVFLWATPIQAFQSTTHPPEALVSEAEKLRSAQRESSSLEALEKYREAVLLFRRDNKTARAAFALRNTGEILQLLGNTAEATTSYQQALALARRARDFVEQGKTLNDLAYLHFVAGNTREAESYAGAALAIGGTLHNQEIEAAALSNLGEALYSRGEISKSQQHQQQAISIWRKLGNARGQALTSLALGYDYKNVGEPEKAHRLFLEALSLARHANDLGVETLALIAIGHINRRIGNNQEAIDSFENAKTLAERIGDRTSQATALGGMGGIYAEMGDASKALKYMVEGTDLMERNGKKWGAGEGKMEIGRIHHSLRNEEQALRYLKEAFDLFRSLQMSRLESATLREIGLVYDSLGDTTRALESYKAALKLTRPDEDQREQSYTLNYIGRKYEQLKQFDRALKYYNEALPLSQRSGDVVSEALIHFNLAHLERDRLNLLEARKQIEATLQLVESHRASVSDQELRTTYFATIRNTYDLYIDILMRLHRENPAGGFDREAFAIGEKARARSFLELLSEARTSVRDGVDPVLLNKERELSNNINTKAQYQIQLFAAKRKDEGERVSQELDALVSQLAEVREQIRQASRRLTAPPLPELLSLNDVQKQLLDDDTVLLEYALGDDRSYVWVVTRNSFCTYALSPRAEIEAAAKRLHDLITSRQMIYGEPVNERVVRQANADAQIPSATASLSKLILDPLAGKLGKRKLLLVTDGALQYIPFQMLTDPDSGGPLVATYEIVNAPSASTLSVLQKDAAKRRPAINSVAVLADPVFEIDDPRVKRNANSADTSQSQTEVRQALRDLGVSADGVQIPRLIASGNEAEAIMSAAPWHSGLKAVGFAASRERVMSPELSNYRIVHFATHGIINTERPELSGIVLSLFDSEGHSQNGFLRLHDIYNLHLPADLVVLSACSTGLGKEVRGEGVIGLSRGFMFAGASGVIASLWKVDDDATAELMKHFYDALFQKGMSPSAALRHAQLALSQNKRWESPYYWAGFVIQGNYAETQKFTGPFPGKTQLALLGTVTTALLLISLFIFRRRRRRV